MSSFRDLWQDCERWERIGIALVFTMAVAVILISVLGLSGVLPVKLTNCISVPLLGAIILINGIILWDKNRGIANFLVGSSVFVLLGSIFMVITYIISL